MATITPKQFRIPDELIARVDAAKGHLSRTAFVILALERALAETPDVGHRSAAAERRPEQPATAVAAPAPTRTPNGKARRVAVFASLAEEIKDIRQRPGLSLPERVGLEIEAGERWENRDVAD